MSVARCPGCGLFKACVCRSATEPGHRATLAARALGWAAGQWCHGIVHTYLIPSIYVADPPRCLCGSCLAQRGSTNGPNVGRSNGAHDATPEPKEMK